MVMTTNEVFINFRSNQQRSDKTELEQTYFFFKNYTKIKKIIERKKMFSTVFETRLTVVIFAHFVFELLLLN